MRSIRSKCAVLLLLGLIGFMVSSCAIPTIDPPPAAISVSPDDTSPRTIIVTASIDNNQNALNGKSAITLQFATNTINDNNYIRFTNGEEIICNGTTVKLGSDATYTISVPNENTYSCFYLWKNTSYLMFAVARRTQISPVLVSSRGSKLTVDYTSDDSSHYCSVEANLSDDTQSVNGNSVLENGSGVYPVSDAGTLSGDGKLVMIRTCTFYLTGSTTPFGSVNVTYRSTATIFVMWNQ